MTTPWLKSALGALVVVPGLAIAAGMSGQSSEYSTEQSYQQSGQQGAAFQTLDQDRDGTISQQEAQAHPQLYERWSEVDTDQDGQINRSEFSQFEEQGQQSGQHSGSGQKLPSQEGQRY
ncbi:MAG: EF-hand domain-containing protein [Gammaproteobacteria bacterium]